jgi:hypothetical protein
MEKWKNITGYEGMYIVSNEGQVRALARTIINKNGKEQRFPEKLLIPDESIQGHTTYQRVTLCKNHMTKKRPVHQLVATHYIPNPENKPLINHIDNNGLHNWESNLEWVTHAENMIHAQKQGRLFNSQSKGGKAAGMKAKAAAHIKAQRLIGQYFGYWLVLYPIGRKYGTKPYMRCLCTNCNTEYDVDKGTLVQGKTTHCRHCNYKAR